MDLRIWKEALHARNADEVPVYNPTRRTVAHNLTPPRHDALRISWKPMSERPECMLANREAGIGRLNEIMLSDAPNFSGKSLLRGRGFLAPQPLRDSRLLSDAIARQCDVLNDRIAEHHIKCAGLKGQGCVWRQADVPESTGLNGWAVCLADISDGDVEGHPCATPGHEMSFMPTKVQNGRCARRCHDMQKSRRPSVVKTLVQSVSYHGD